MTDAKFLKSEDQRACETLRLKMAQGIPEDLLPEFQEWLSLEQDLAYERGRHDGAAAAHSPGQFTAT